MKTGIYKITNTINGKVYVGSAVDIKKRWRDHKWHLNNNKHHNSHLQSSWNKYGINSFNFEILLECEISELLTFELDYIIKYDCFNNKLGYNVNDPEHIFLNKKHTDKTKALLSKQKMGNKNPMFGKCGNKHPRYNKATSVETRDKISLNRKGLTVGDNHPSAKLNSEDIIKIREMNKIDNISQTKIAKLYNVSLSNINSIINRKSWSHI